MKIQFKFRLIVCLVLLLWVMQEQTSALYAQDTKMPHPFMWKSFNNPGYSGFEGFAGINMGMQRNYWSKPFDFRSYFVSADYPFKDKKVFGLGGVSVFYQRDEESSLRYVTNSLAVAISGRVQVSRTTVLQLGIQPVVYQKGLDQSRLTLGDQFDPFYGQILDVSPEMLDFYADKITLFDFAIGLYGRTFISYPNHEVASLEYGFSAYHVIEPTQSFLSKHGSVSSVENLINRRYSFFTSYSHPLWLYPTLSTNIIPYLMFDKQGAMRNLQFGVNWEEERFGMIGAGLRKDNYQGMSISTLLFHAGAYVMQKGGHGLKVAYTCEIPTSQGTIYKNTSHSLSLHWYFPVNVDRCSLFGDVLNTPRRVKTKPLTL